MLLSNVINFILIIVIHWKIEEKLDYDCKKILSQLKNVYKDDEKITVININKKNEDKNINVLKIRKNSKSILERENINNKELTIVENNENQVDESGSRNIINKKDLIKEKEEEKEEEKNVKKLKTPKNNLFYLTILIKNIVYKERRKYLSNNELNNLPYKYALLIDNRSKSKFY